jgi:hypothetical protein
MSQGDDDLEDLPELAASVLGRRLSPKELYLFRKYLLLLMEWNRVYALEQ